MGFAQCDQIWQKSTTLAKFKTLRQLFEGLVSVGHNFEPTLANFHCSKWLYIKQLIVLWSQWICQIKFPQHKKSLVLDGDSVA